MVDKSDKFTQLVRVGYFSRAILYGVLGLLALSSAGRIGEGANSVFEAIDDVPAGTLLLWIVALGLVAYALFRFASTFFDIEHEGSDTKGWAKRIAHAASGAGHLILAWSAVQFATSGSGGGGAGGNGGAQEAASGILSISLGSVVLGIIGIGFLLGAAHEAKIAYTGEFMRRISPQAPEPTRWIGGAGHAARAAVYLIIGWSLVRAGWLSSSAEVETLGGAIASLSDDGAWFTLMAIGLLAFGLFSLILARYRIIPDLDVQGRVPAFRA